MEKGESSLVFEIDIRDLVRRSSYFFFHYGLPRFGGFFSARL